MRPNGWHRSAVPLIFLLLFSNCLLSLVLSAPLKTNDSSEEDQHYDDDDDATHQTTRSSQANKNPANSDIHAKMDLIMETLVGINSKLDALTNHVETTSSKISSNHVVLSEQGNTILKQLAIIRQEYQEASVNQKEENKKKPKGNAKNSSQDKSTNPNGTANSKDVDEDRFLKDKTTTEKSLYDSNASNKQDEVVSDKDSVEEPQPPPKNKIDKPAKSESNKKDPTVPAYIEETPDLFAETQPQTAQSHPFSENDNWNERFAGLNFAPAFTKNDRNMFDPSSVNRNPHTSTKKTDQIYTYEENRKDSRKSKSSRQEDSKSDQNSLYKAIRYETNSKGVKNEASSEDSGKLPKKPKSVETPPENQNQSGQQSETLPDESSETHSSESQYKAEDPNSANNETEVFENEEPQASKQDDLENKESSQESVEHDAARQNHHLFITSLESEEAKSSSQENKEGSRDSHQMSETTDDKRKKDSDDKNGQDDGSYEVPANIESFESSEDKPDKVQSTDTTTETLSKAPNQNDFVENSQSSPFKDGNTMMFYNNPSFARRSGYGSPYGPYGPINQPRNFKSFAVNRQSKVEEWDIQKNNSPQETAFFPKSGTRISEQPPRKATLPQDSKPVEETTTMEPTELTATSVAPEEPPPKDQKSELSSAEEKEYEELFKDFETEFKGFSSEFMTGFFNNGNNGSPKTMQKGAGRGFFNFK